MDGTLIIHWQIGEGDQDEYITDSAVLLGWNSIQVQSFPKIVVDPTFFARWFVRLMWQGRAHGVCHCRPDMKISTTEFCPCRTCNECRGIFKSSCKQNVTIYIYIYIWSFVWPCLGNHLDSQPDQKNWLRTRRIPQTLTLAQWVSCWQCSHVPFPEGMRPSQK